MKVELLIHYIKQLGIEVITGVPDSTLTEFCDYINTEKTKLFHYTVPNEGAAVGIAVGTYLATGNPACVYMQNSGLGNTINPITSIVNAEVYNIPVFFIVGYRGSSEKKDEPQHKFMGRITEKMLDCLEIEYDIIDNRINEIKLKEIFNKAQSLLDDKKQFVLMIKRDTFDKRKNVDYFNNNTLNREYVIAEIIKKIKSTDLIVSSTGKISREVYEQSNFILNHHNQCFLTVGGMGYASMIAFGIAKSLDNKRIICIDGDSAILMHMGNLAFIGEQNIDNMIHICLNNSAHESVGGMPTSAQNLKFVEIAKTCGYSSVFIIQSLGEFEKFINVLDNLKRLTFAEIKVANTSREDLNRPKESALDNAVNFMNYINPSTDEND